MRKRFFALLAQRAHVGDRVLRVAVFFTSSVTGVTAATDLGVGPEWFAFVTALLAAASFTLEFGAVAMKHTGFGVAWSGIYQDTLDLWTESEQGVLAHRRSVQPCAPSSAASNPSTSSPSPIESTPGC